MFIFSICVLLAISFMLWRKTLLKDTSRSVWVILYEKLWLKYKAEYSRRHLPLRNFWNTYCTAIIMCHTNFPNKKLSKLIKIYLTIISDLDANFIIMKTIIPEIADECLDNLILNAINTIRKKMKNVLMLPPYANLSIKSQKY